MGRAIAEAVSRWLPTAAAPVRARVWSSVICGGQIAAGAGFLRVRHFPLPSTKFFIFIITRGRYNRPEVADVQSGPSAGSTPLCELKKKKSYESNMLFLCVYPFSF
jgi:hypothetical protein